MDQNRSASSNTTVESLKAAGQDALKTGARAMFASDPGRFDALSFRHDDLLLDVSKCALRREDLAALVEFAGAVGVEARRDAMFAGAKINTTEGRSVLHVALRARPEDGFKANGQPVGSEVESVLQAMAAFADGIRSGSIAAANGKKITDVVNIGIGGSDLGPVMACLALAPYHDGPRTHFVSNIDGAHMADTLELVDLETTLFIVASKTFTTIETMTNAQTARRAVAEKLGEAAVGAHFAAVSTALDKVKAFGIGEDRIFGFWDWVGGRYSVWSAIGLPLMLAIGPERFREFLDGARDLDQHFKTAPVAENLPMILGLVGWWNRVAQGHPTRAVIPYDQRLARLPAYLQQLDMESNGKHVGLDGRRVEITGPVVWGEPGTNGQHAFFQLLHQGTDIIPVEFIVAANAHETGPDMKIHQDLLLANCLAQSEALMKGRTLEEAREQLLKAGRTPDEAERIAPHREFSGDRPSITILYSKLTPFAFGRLIAIYEHRVFVEAQLFGINAYDQWGVELGKELATGLQPVIEGKTSAAGRDSSTAGLVAAIANLRT